MVKLEELEVGQLVEHEAGFIGKVFEVETDGGVRIEVTDSGTSEYEVGYKYYANYNWIVRIVAPAPNPHKLTIEVETVGMEKAVELGKEMVLLAEDMADIRKEESVFKAELGNGITFEGTKSDFKAFMEGVTEMFSVAKNMGL
ncbi:hypothetical protein PDJ86_22535 [Bacillus cereus group sp. TH36-2LC]|uniref:hypothetical protein n=1 Tax=Bacillus cereus group sp. TH36-2LC TaxID=3018040 RepID=UPI0022E3939D|nr:hypothetical protein [Bacillus cereus group sp. TH36-2LC]MDA1509638.1 hypothetical protein [Bacillus cereus group sp. TH36-2LC]